MNKYPIHDTTESANHGKAVPGYSTYNPIPEGTILHIFYKDMKILIKIDMNFYTVPEFAIFEILDVVHGED